jgi:hypothetical protein
MDHVVYEHADTVTVTLHNLASAAIAQLHEHSDAERMIDLVTGIGTDLTYEQTLAMVCCVCEKPQQQYKAVISAIMKQHDKGVDLVRHLMSCGCIFDAAQEACAQLEKDATFDATLFTVTQLTNAQQLQSVSQNNAAKNDLLATLDRAISVISNYSMNEGNRHNIIVEAAAGVLRAQCLYMKFLTANKPDMAGQACEAFNKVNCDYGSLSTMYNALPSLIADSAGILLLTKLSPYIYNICWAAMQYCHDHQTHGSTDNSTFYQMAAKYYGVSDSSIQANHVTATEASSSMLRVLVQSNSDRLIPSSSHEFKVSNHE